MEAQAITEAEIKEQQLVIAQWMQVPEEIIGILNQELPWRIQEWIYTVRFGSENAGRDFRKNAYMGVRKNPKRADGIPAEKISGYRFIGTGNERKSGSAGNPGCQ